MEGKRGFTLPIYALLKGLSILAESISNDEWGGWCRRRGWMYQKLLRVLLEFSGACWDIVTSGRGEPPRRTTNPLLPTAAGILVMTPYVWGLPPDFWAFKNHQNHRFCLSRELETMTTPMKHEKTILRANYQLCSSSVALFQVKFVFLLILFHLWIDNLKFVGRPRHHFAHLGYGGVPFIKSVSLINFSQALYWVCILNFGMCWLCDFLVSEDMKGTINMAVVDLAPYGFVFK